MASGLFKAGVDLDTLFMARVNVKRADVGIKVVGVDISNRYEAIGAATAIANVGFKSVGVDLATLFRDINQSLQTHTLTSAIYDATAEIGSTTIYRGFSTHVFGGFGALAPTTYAGAQVQTILDGYFGGSSGNIFLVEMAGVRAANFFSSITVNGITYLTSAASFGVGAAGGAPSSWSWPSMAGLTAGSYPIAINP
jgi:hypothetical protein